MQGYVIFTDLEKYSQLKDSDLRIYYDKIVPVIYEKLRVHKSASLIWNTWGDAIVAAYNDGMCAVNMALDYKNIMLDYNFEQIGMQRLRPRIAGHFGEFDVLFDPVSGKINMHGTNVNLAARIEPVTSPGEIFVSKDFRDKITSDYLAENIRFDDMGLMNLPKDAGKILVYRLCKASDAEIPSVGKVINVSSLPNLDKKNRSGFKK